MNQRPQRICESCRETQTFFSGISKKSGNPYEVWKCESCGKTDWNPTPRQPQQTQFIKKGQNIAVKTEPNWDAIRLEKEAGMEWLNAKNNAAAIVVKEIELGNLKDTETMQVLFQSWLRFIYDQKQPKNDNN